MHAIMVVGMAGSGKTTFMQRLNAHLHEDKQPPYIMNLDPAVKNVPFDRNIDIRDSVNYKEVMKQYNLGPNGGIMTCLNLFATKIDQVVGLLEKRAADVERVLIDTPGQIECFVWSASGQIITDAIASAIPTVLAYIIDTPRTTSTSTFMSNMLYACSILYKTKLPMILVFNKTDVQDASFAKEWMTDFEAFQSALQKEADNSDGEGGSGYMGSLMNSMSLVLDEFYAHLDIVPVSAVTGAGIADFFKAVESKVEEYKTDYLPELEKARAKREDDKEAKRQKELNKLMADMDLPSVPAGPSTVKKSRSGLIGVEKADTVSDAEEEEEEEDDEYTQALARENDDDDDDDDEGEDYVEGMDEDHGMGDGLVDRYQRALKEDAEESGRGEDASFVRYLKKSGGGA